MCVPLRGKDPTVLVYCQENIGLACSGAYLCEGHFYEIFGMCRKCFQFIQDPKNDDKLIDWEQKNVRTQTQKTD